MTLTKGLARSEPPFTNELLKRPSSSLPLTTDERLKQIEALRQRIDRAVEFICNAGAQNGNSAEAREKAIVIFHERMLILEGQLSRIKDELLLG